jgi:hypothetical protein
LPVSCCHCSYAQDYALTLASCCDPLPWLSAAAAAVLLLPQLHSRCLPGHPEVHSRCLLALALLGLITQIQAACQLDACNRPSCAA